MPINQPSIVLSYGGEKVNETTKRYALGTRAVLPDGRVFYYALANGAIGAGQLCQAKAAIIDFDMDLSVEDAPAVGAATFQVLSPSTHQALGSTEFEDGYVGVNDGPGEGHIYRLNNHSSLAADGNTLLTLTMAIDDTVQEAMTTASLVGLLENEFKDVVPVDIDTTLQQVLGVASTEIADNEYFWLQTWGYASVRSEGGTQLPTLGQTVTAAVSTSDQAGSIEAYELFATALPVQSSTLPGRDLPVVGVAVGVVSVNSDHQLISLTLRP